MRFIAGIALSGLAFIANLEAQSLAEHAAAAAGATAGTAAGKPMSNAITKIFGQVDDQAKSASHTTGKLPQSVTRPASTTAQKPSPAGAPAGPDGPLPAGPVRSGAGASSAASPDDLTEPAPARPAKSARRKRQQETAILTETPSPAALTPITAPPAPIELTPKEPTTEEVSNIQLGAKENDVLATLGVPASRTTIPDDDGHLRETFQYWAKGSPVGTIRLDNGQVVKVDARKF